MFRLLKLLSWERADFRYNPGMNESTELKRTVLAQHLRRHIEGEIRFDATSRRLYSTDGSIYHIEPLGVVIPRTAEDIVAVVQIAGEMGMPDHGPRRRHVAVRPVDRPWRRPRLQQVPQPRLDIDPAGRVARVQPGVVLDQFNRALAPHGLQFGPEVATASRANLGGMIGNNSAGARSIVYGKTIDHVRRLASSCRDGSRTEFGPLTPAEWEARPRSALWRARFTAACARRCATTPRKSGGASRASCAASAGTTWIAS